MLVCAAIEDEFAVISGQCPQLEPPGFASEESIVLGDLDRACVRYGGCFRCHGLDALNARFDFNVPCHGCLGLTLRFSGER